MKGFRIALRKFAPTAKAAFSGLSGYSVDGRWHTKGRHLDYAAESVSLATLERLVHYKRFNLLEPHVLCTIEVPDSAIRRVGEPPKGWDGEETSAAAQAVGDRWFDEALSPVLLVPSTISRGEYNLLVNASHPDWNTRWLAARCRPFRFDARLDVLANPKREPRTSSDKR